MVEATTVCLRSLGDGRSGTVRFGRFLSNPKVTTTALIEGWSAGTAAAVRGRHVLALQDTTEAHFRTTAGRRRGLGATGKGNVYGLMVHPVLVIDAESGVCHGLAGGKIWTRGGLAQQPHRKRRSVDKESGRWLDVADAAKEVLAGAAQVTVVADREADLYTAWAGVPAPAFHLLIRANTNRVLADGKRLYDAPAAWPAADRRIVELRERADRRPRQAVLTLRYGEVAIKRPDYAPDKHLPPSLKLRLIEVRELDPPAGEEPLLWRLLTTHALADAAYAWEIVRWYTQRWHIEQLFRTMKSQGLGIEDSQIADAERLLKLAAIATRAACIIMQLVQARDGKTNQPAADVFPSEEIATMDALLPKIEGATAKQKNPHPPHSLAWAAWIIARLGGWSGYASYRPPGPITMRNGLERFKAIALGFTLQHV